MNWLRTLAQKIFKQYDLYWIYESQNGTPAASIAAGFEFAEISKPEEIQSAAPEIRLLSSYLLQDSRCFIIRKDQEIVSGCVYWWGQTYTIHRNFWALLPNEAKLVQISTVPSCRKLGLASALISHSAMRMRESGFRRLYARIWHSNRSSVRAFERANWGKRAFRARLVIPFVGARTFTRYYKK